MTNERFAFDLRIEPAVIQARQLGLVLSTELPLGDPWLYFHGRRGYIKRTFRVTITRPSTHFLKSPNGSHNMTSYRCIVILLALLLCFSSAAPITFSTSIDNTLPSSISNEDNISQQSSMIPSSWSTTER